MHSTKPSSSQTGPAVPANERRSLASAAPGTSSAGGVGARWRRCTSGPYLQVYMYVCMYVHTEVQYRTCACAVSTCAGRSARTNRRTNSPLLVSPAQPAPHDKPTLYSLRWHRYRGVARLQAGPWRAHARTHARNAGAICGRRWKVTVFPGRGRGCGCLDAARAPEDAVRRQRSPERGAVFFA